MSTELRKATHDGVLEVGEVVVPCYVLEDTTRVISQRGLQSSIGMSKGGAAKVGARRLLTLVGRFETKGIAAKDLMARLDTPILFQPPHGGRSAFGYEATVLTDICEFILQCRDMKLLTTPRQEIYAKAAEIVLRALAKVGIIALIDEATNYQEVRDRLALQKILEKYLTDEWAKWTKTFPDEFYRELFRLQRLPYPPTSGKRPSYVGHWTNDIVYSRLAPGVLKELRKKNPVSSSGLRKRKHHQYLTRDIGHPALKDHLMNIIFLMRGCTSWSDFKRRLERASPKYGDTFPLELSE